MFCVIIIRSWSFFASYQLSDKLLDEENFLDINFSEIDQNSRNLEKLVR